MNNHVISISAILVWTLACSDEPNTSPPPATYVDTAAVDALYLDDSKTVDATTASDISPQDSIDIGSDTSQSDSFPDGFLEPLDAAPQDTSSAIDTGVVPIVPVGKLYAHTASELYQLDLATKAIVSKGTFSFDKNTDEITDIALDKFGKLYAIGFAHVFVCNTKDAKCKWLAKLSSSFNGLTFVPEDVVTAGKDALIGISSKGEWTHIRIEADEVKLNKLGVYGDGWLSSGDAFSVVGVGTFATLKGKGNSDSLARIDPASGKIVKVIGETGAKGLFGLAWWAGDFYAFSKTGAVYTLDIKTGKATEVTSLKAPAGVKWWGAGVSTRANGG